MEAEHFLVGVLAGAGIDEILRRLSLRVVELQQQSPIPAPPGYEDPKLHWDDVISLGSGIATTIAGIATDNKDMAALGIGMALGSYLISIWTPYC